MRYLVRLAIAAALAAPLAVPIAVPLPASAATPSAVTAPAVTLARAEDLAWSVRPATAQGQPDARTHYTLQGTPGQTLQDQVLITNASTVEVTFDVYSTDAFNTPSGAFDLLPASKQPVDIGAWMAFPAPRVTIPAGASQAVAFRVAVPTNAAPGDHAGGVVVAVSSGNDVRLDARVAVRVYLRVPGFLRPTLAVPYVRPVYHGVVNPVGGGGIDLAYTVANTGNIRLSSHPTLVVKSAIFGIRLAQKTLEDLPELLPGQQVSYTAHVDGVFPAGPLTVSVELRPFADPTQPVGQAIPTGVGKSTVWALPWLLLVLVLALGGLGFMLLRRRLIRRRRDSQGARVVTGAADTDKAAGKAAGKGPAKEKAGVTAGAAS